MSFPNFEQTTPADRITWIMLTLAAKRSKNSEYATEYIELERMLSSRHDDDVNDNVADDYV